MPMVSIDPSDPGGEIQNAPIGSELWAKRVRLELQSIVDDLPKAAVRADGYFKLVLDHRAWTLMNKEDGSRFQTFDEFCAYRRPWGLGKPYSEIRPHLEALHGKRAVDLIAVAPSRQGERVDVCSGGGNTSPPEAEKLKTTDKVTRLRAVLRAPEPVQVLFQRGLIGQKEAARLGPAKPTPEQAASVVEVTQALAAIIATADTSTDGSKRAVAREVNKTVRTLLGAARDPVERLHRAFSRLSAADKRRFRRMIDAS